MTATETYGPFDTLPWADQTQWYRFAPAWAQSGVIDSPAASASAGSLGLSFSGLTPTLAAGRAWARGAGYEISGGSRTLSAIAANANTTLSRRDRIVLRRDLAAKTVAPVLIQGTPSGTPVAPALTQVETGQWDVPLFSFLVPPNSGTSITGIVDERACLNPGSGNLAFASTAGRDANFPTVPDGAYCYTEDAGGWRGVGGVWKADKITGLLSLASGWGQYNNYPLPGYHLDANGKVTAHGAMLRTSGGNIAVNASGLLIGSLPAAVRPSGDMAPRVYFGSGSPVQRVSGVLYVDSTSAGLMQLLSFDGGSYTINQGSGFVFFDGLTWYV